MDKETAFLQKINDRQVEAYRILYDEYYPALVVYASTFLASDEVAEDIVQELFVSMWEKRVTFVSFPAFKTYLYKFIKNSALNYLKHQGVEERYKEALQNNLSDEELDEEELDREEEYREIFLLSLEGKKNKEIAEMLQISTETIKTQKIRAINRLKKYSGILFSFLFSVYR